MEKMERIQKLEKEDQQFEMVQQLLSNFIGYSQGHGNLLNKYTDDFYLVYFDRLRINETVKKVQSHQKQLGMPEFIRLFLGSIIHSEEETLYLTISLIRLYKKIKEDTNNEKGVKFADFTNFLCNKISQGDPDLVIPMREIPIEKTIPDVSKVRDIDISPPPILNKVQIQRPKIVKNKNKKDKKLDEKKPVSQFVFSPSLNAVIALGRLSSSITLYNPDTLKKMNKIIPIACKLMSKDVAILSLAYSQRDKRIGCVINNIGITFWQASDNFVTQKILGSNKSDHDPKAYGDKIYFLNLFNQWATADKDTIYFWDIKQETVSRTIKKQKSYSINDICQINHIRSLLVAYTLQGNPQTKCLILYSGPKQVSRLPLQNSGCHSLLYNQSTQLVVLLGYSNMISVYHIDVQTYDINLIAQLKGHSSILTCICNVPNTSMIISGDDVGNVKLWDLNYMRCLQGIKIAKTLIQINCFDNMLIYADSRINTVPIETSGRIKLKAMKSDGQKQQCKDQQSYGIYQFFRKQQETLWVITRKEARQIDIKTGRVTHILLLSNFQEEISAAAQVYNGFVIGTSKGQLFKYGFDGQRKWHITAHESQINTIKVDFENHLIATVGGDNIIAIWAEKSILDDKNNIRKKITYKNKDVNLFELSPYSNILVIGSTNDNTVQIWNYDTLKLLQTVQLESYATAFTILSDKSLIVIATVMGSLYVVNFSRKQNKLTTQCVFSTNINESVGSLQENQILKENTVDVEGDDNSEIQLKSYFNYLAYSQDTNMLIAATLHGKIYCYGFKGWPTNENYRRQYEPAPAIRRSSRQSYDLQILKNKYRKCKIENIISKNQRSYLKLLWSQKVHKQNLTFINVLNLEKKYACTLCSDGYCKLTELQSSIGLVVGSLKLSYPLPVKWDIQIQNYCQLKNQIHQAIAVIDSILKNYGYDLTINEQITLNITQFLQKMLTKSYKVTKPKMNPQLMKHQFSQHDLKGQFSEKSASLKSLQAYKRLQLIKKQNQQSLQKQNKDQIYHYQTSTLQKQAIRNFLSPNYLPRILNRLNNDQSFSTDPKSFNLLKRIEDGFNGLTVKQGKKLKEGDRQNKCISQVTKALSQSNSDIINKSSFMKSVEQVKDKSVQEILGQINNKLQNYKRNRTGAYKTHI